MPSQLPVDLAERLENVISSPIIGAYLREYYDFYDLHEAIQTFIARLIKDVVFGQYLLTRIQ